MFGLIIRNKGREEEVTKKVIMRVVIICLLLLSFVSDTLAWGTYDDGYEDGFHESGKRVAYKLSSAYRKGYEDGDEARYYYDMGYYDAKKKGSPDPEYLDDPDYTDGYLEAGGKLR